MKPSGRWIFASWAVLMVAGGLSGCGAPAKDSLVAQVNVPQQELLPAETESVPRVPQSHEVRKQVAADPDSASSVATSAAGIPRVLLSTEHSAMCRVRVGDELPEISLRQLSGPQTDLSSLRGKKATVVLFWQSDSWMSQTALKDLESDFAASEDIAVVGIAVQESESEIQSALKDTSADFPQLLDSDGKAFNQVGMVRMPRVYVLDAAGKIAWFDIEYSQSTQRELKQTVAALTSGS